MKTRFPFGATASVIWVTIAVGLPAVAAQAAEEFPFDRELILDSQPMRPAKRLPILTVAAGGAAVIDLWCKTVNGRVEIGEGSITISAEPLPDAMPAMLAPGQCTPERMQADATLLATLTQAAGWRRLGDGVQLTGPEVLTFRPADH